MTSNDSCEDRYRIGDLEIDFLRRSVQVKDKTIGVTPRESQILKCLSICDYPLSLADLSDRLYANEINGGPTCTNTIRTQIFTLRRKLRKISGGKCYIDSYGWSGYRLRDKTCRDEYES